ncbi:unnamed protein product [Leptosia nina]|uniref:Carboxylic ester hydrolase n=1 Tax=Leptosia nina TaxID=320188 RepID=A0AAV1IX18_9NEOP
MEGDYTWVSRALVTMRKTMIAPISRSKTLESIVALVLCTLCNAAFAQDTNYRDVKIEQGVVRGYRSVEENIFTFQSIPYAIVPSGLDFYKAPLPPPSWNDTFDAVDRKIICQQHRQYPPGLVEVKEQCLIVNVFVPDTKQEKLPVVVFVHGGAFLFGYGNSRTPKNLVKSGKIIAVTFNYRVGPHGFLCLGTDAAPGNAGMKDQIELLRWVQRNIAEFGGDTSDVTIAGCSAGSASIDLLLISKQSKGLFKRAIGGSGSNLNAFAVQTRPLENAKYFAQQMGFNDTNDIVALEKFYLNTPYEALSLKSAELAQTTNSVTLFSPCVEKDIGQEIFLHDSPFKILSDGNFLKVPMLYGYCNMEGIYRVNMFDTWRDKMNENFVNFLTPDLGNDEENRVKLAEDIKRLYFGVGPVTNSSILDYIDFFTDIMFGYGMLRSAKLQLDVGNDQLYLYKYSFADESDDYIPHTAERGATHCAQAHAVMDLGDESKLSEKYRNVKVIMRDLWLNFITTGVPVPAGSNYPAWPPMSQQRSYMSLNSTLEFRDSMLSERTKFWEEAFAKYYKYPAPPNPTSSSTSINVPHNMHSDLRCSNNY